MWANVLKIVLNRVQGRGTNVDTVLKQNQLKKTAQLLTFTIMFGNNVASRFACVCGFFWQRNCIAS